LFSAVRFFINLSGKRARVAWRFKNSKQAAASLAILLHHTSSAAAASKQDLKYL